MQSVSLEDLIGHKAGVRHEHAKQLFENVFDCLQWTRISGGKAESVVSLDRWRHRQPAEVEGDLLCLEINRQELLLSLAVYLSNPDLASEEADWLFLNTLTYAEYIATVGELRRSAMGVDRYVKSLFRPNKEHTTDIAILARRPWHLPLMLGLIVLSLAIHPLVGAAAIAYAVLIKYRRKKAGDQINATLASMFQTYLSFNTVHLSWTQVIHMLERSRDAGAIWDGSLYALAESRARANQQL